MDAGRLFGTAGSTWHRPVSPGSRLMRVWEEHQPAGQYSPSHRATIVSWLEFRTPLPGVRDTNGNPGSSDGVVDPGPDGGVDPVDPRPVPTPESVGLAGGGLLLLLSLRRRAG